MGSPKNKMPQANVRYAPDLLRRAEKAAQWEGLTKAAFFRAALTARVRKVEAERKKEEGDAG